MTTAEAWAWSRRWFWLICVGVFAASALAYLVTVRAPKVYESTTTLLVPPSSGGGLGLPSATLAEVLKSRSVLEAALSAAGAQPDTNQLSPQIDVVARRDAPLIDLKVRARDATEAAQLATALVAAANRSSQTTAATQLESRRTRLLALVNARAAVVAESARQVDDLLARPPETVADYELGQARARLAQAQQSAAAATRSLAELDLAGAASGGGLRPIEPASVPTQPAQPRLVLTLLGGALLGLLFGVAAACAGELVSGPVISPANVRRRTGVPLIGELAHSQRQPATLATSGSGASELGALLPGVRTMVQARLRDQTPTSLLVTSSVDGEGKTTLAMALAAALAQAGEQVVLVDGNLARPTLAGVFGVKERIGLSTLLNDARLVAPDALALTPMPGLRLLTAGPSRPNSADLVASSVLRQHILTLCEVASVVIVDGPSLAVSDAIALSSAVDGVLLVVDARLARATSLRTAMMRLEQVPVTVLGVVFNHLARPGRRSAHPADDRRWRPAPRSLGVGQSQVDRPGGTPA